MNKSRHLWLAGSVAAALTLFGCGGGGGDGGSSNGGGGGGGVVAAPVAFVPDSAGASVAAFIAYLMNLDGNDETSEPLALRDAFAVPDDNVGDATPII